MQAFRQFFICCLITVILPWGAFAQAVSPQALFIATAASSTITLSSADSVVTPQPKRCRIAILTGQACSSAILGHGGTTTGGGPQESTAPFSVVIQLPDGVETSWPPDPPRLG